MGNTIEIELTQEQMDALDRRAKLIVKRKLNADARGFEVMPADKELLAKGLVDFKVAANGFICKATVMAYPEVYSGTVGGSVEVYFVPKDKFEKYADYVAHSGYLLALYIVDAKAGKILMTSIQNLAITQPFQHILFPMTVNQHLIFAEEQFDLFCTLTKEECNYILYSDDDPVEKSGD